MHDDIPGKLWFMRTMKNVALNCDLYRFLIRCVIHG